MLPSDRPLIAAIPPYIRRHAIVELQAAGILPGRNIQPVQVHAMCRRLQAAGLTMADLLSALVRSARAGDARGIEGLRILLSSIPTLGTLHHFLPAELRRVVSAVHPEHLSPPSVAAYVLGRSVGDLTVLMGLPLAQVLQDEAAGGIVLAPPDLYYTPTQAYADDEETITDVLIDTLAVVKKERT